MGANMFHGLSVSVSNNGDKTNESNLASFSSEI